MVIGSANFPENEVLAEVYALALQAKGVKATTKLNIGAREVYYPQVEKGAITIIPEYNGTLLTVEADPTSTAKTTAAVDAALAAKLPSTLTVLNPAPAQDSDSITVTAATAAKDHLKTIADLKPYASSMVLGGPPEFKTRSDGIAGPQGQLRPDLQELRPARRVGPDHPGRADQRQGAGRRRVHHHAADHHRQAGLARRTRSSTSPRRTSSRSSTSPP